MKGGFSIREYTSRMRSVNVVNCWPFDEAFGEETVKSLLPSIVVKRFTWWLDELQLLHSETAEKIIRSEKKSEKVLEKGETSSRNVDRDSEGAEDSVKVVKVKSSKGKMRATKKRSIVEIFAVAPPVKRAISWGEEEADEVEEGGDASRNSHNVRINRVRKKKKMNNTDILLSKAMRVVKRKKATEKRGGDGIGVSDKNCFKQHTQEKATRNSSSSCSKELENDIQDCVSNLKRKPMLQYKKFVPCKGFRLIEEDQHSELPVRGILKNQIKESSLKQSKKCLKQKAVQLNGRGTKNVNKHVTFLENDELLRPSQKPSQSCFELQKDCGSGMGSVDCAVAVGNDSSSSKTSARVGKGIDAGSAGNEQLTMLSGKQWADHDLRDDAQHNAVDACHPGFLRMPRDDSQDVEVITTSSNTTCRRLSNDLGTPSSIFPPLCLVDYLRTHSDESVSHLSNMKRTYDIHFQAFPHPSPNEQLQTGNEEFVGLPLNSQGELIMLTSNAEREANQMMNSNTGIGLSLPSNAVSKSLNSRTSPRGRQLNLFPVESYVKENAIAVIPSTLVINESQSEKANPDLGFPVMSYHPYHNSGKTICRGNNQVQKNEKYQSTMRLMGKEFEVGGRNIQGFEDEGMWKDKQMIDELHFQHEPSLVELKETLYHPSEVTVNHSSKNKYALPQTSYNCGQNYFPSGVHNSKSLFDFELFKASAPHQELCSNMIPRQNLHCSPISAIKFPFMHPDLDGQSSWARRSSLIPQPLCFDVSEKAAQLRNSQSCTLGHVMNSSVPFPPDGFCMFSPLPTGSVLQSMDPAPSPYYPGVLPVSAMQRKHGRIKERIKSRIGLQELNICKKSKGQLSVVSNALKRQSLGFHEGLQCAVRKPSACDSFQDGASNMEDAFGSPRSYTQHSRIVMSVEYDETNKDGQPQTIFPFVDSCWNRSHKAYLEGLPAER